MIDINKTLDLIKLKFFNEWLYTAHMSEQELPAYNLELINKMVETYIDPLNLAKDAVILDIGCGSGYFLDAMKSRGYTNVTGITLSETETKICREKGHNIKNYDMTCIPQKDGYHDESVDFIFCRQTIEHSPYPIITLAEFNRLLKEKGRLYLETPTPDSALRHEYNPNKYSVFGIKQWDALLNRAGFSTTLSNSIEFEVEKSDGEKLLDKYMVMVVYKRCPLDIK
jgi:2-polyprenyl-3-methyl-5-hydroxy-6-metoxy-1,4-benzoquinol methylase